MVLVLYVDVLIPGRLAVVYGMSDGITRCVYALAPMSGARAQRRSAPPPSRSQRTTQASKMPSTSTSPRFRKAVPVSGARFPCPKPPASARRGKGTCDVGSENEVARSHADASASAMKRCARCANLWIEPECCGIDSQIYGICHSALGQHGVDDSRHRAHRLDLQIA